MSTTNGVLSAAGYAATGVERRSSSAPVCPDDKTLMLRIQGGDEQALALLLERYGNLVLGIGLKILRDRDEAEELVQDVFFQLYRKSHLYDSQRGTTRAWLLQMAYHRAFDRREYLQVRRFYDSKSVEELVDVMRASCDVEHQASVNQGEAILRRAFEQLNEKQRQTLTLFFLEGYTLREISEALKEPLPNVRHHYYRGLKHLKDKANPTTGEKGTRTHDGL